MRSLPKPPFEELWNAILASPKHIMSWENSISSAGNLTRLSNRLKTRSDMTRSYLELTISTDSLVFATGNQKKAGCC